MARKFKPSGRDQYVVPYNHGWAVKDAGSIKPWRVFETLGEATVIAMRRAGKNRSDVKVFGTDDYASHGDPKFFESLAK